jgi:cytochrome c556
MLAPASLFGLFLALPAAAADLPAGPLHDRHELMEEIGKNAKAIGEAGKAGKPQDAVEPATKIQEAAKKIPDLFPKGSTHPESRAKPEIWDNWERFVELAKGLETTAGDVATAAKTGGDLGAAAGPLFLNCKTCHEAFRKPDEE